MYSDPVVKLEELGKCYRIYEKPRDRLLQMLTRGEKQLFREFWALSGATLNVNRGECLGLVGRNGAGKSTLLQLVCGTLSPSRGSVSVNGRITALLELGAGFNPEFTGRENVYLSAALYGLSKDEIDERFAEIVDFSGIGSFIDQPIKTYSSGMSVRLAFSIATSVDPDVLVIDEALSVGDGEFSKKSFNRIMNLREDGKTILFCSHSMHHVEMLCDRVCWLEKGKVALIDSPAEVAKRYEAALLTTKTSSPAHPPREAASGPVDNAGCAKLVSVETTGGDKSGGRLQLRSEKDDLSVQVVFQADSRMPPPAIAVSIYTGNGQVVTSALSKFDGVNFQIDSSGCGSTTLDFPTLPLLKGDYYVGVFLTCAEMIQVYDAAKRCAEFSVTQEGPAQGLASLPRQWHDRAES